MTFAEQLRSVRFSSHVSRAAHHGWRNAIVVGNKVLADHCLDLAAQMSFYFVLSIFPFFLVMAAIIGWLPSTNLWQAFAQWVITYLPRDSRHLVFSIIFDLSRDATKIFSVGLLIMVWGASSGFVSMMESLSVAYGTPDTRSYWKKRTIAIGATLVAALFFIACFGLLSLGHRSALWISGDLGPLTAHQNLWGIGRWVGTFLLLCLGIDLVNYSLPMERGRWRWFSLGTAFTAVTLVAESIGLNFYVRQSPSLPRIYGTLTGFIVMMLWIYVANFVLLVGAETDQAIGARLK